MGAFEFPSGEVEGLIFTANDQLEWQARVGEREFNVYRGDLQRLKNSGTYTQPTLFALVDTFCGVLFTTLPLVETFEPGPGETVFYLVSLDGLTFEGSLGEDSAGMLRENERPCP